MHTRKFQRRFDAKGETNNGNTVGCRALMSWVSEGNVSGNIFRKYNGSLKFPFTYALSKM